MPNPIRSSLFATILKIVLVVPVCCKLVWNMGVIFDQKLSMKEQVNKMSGYILWTEKDQYLSDEATKTLVTSLVLSRLDYCNTLLAGIPQNLDKVQKVINCAARLVCRSLKWDYIAPLPADLHQLPISSRIEYNIATVCSVCLIWLGSVLMSSNWYAGWFLCLCL